MDRGRASGRVMARLAGSQVRESKPSTCNRGWRSNQTPAASFEASHSPWTHRASAASMSRMLFSRSKASTSRRSSAAGRRTGRVVQWCQPGMTCYTHGARKGGAPVCRKQAEPPGSRRLKWMAKALSAHQPMLLPAMPPWRTRVLGVAHGRHRRVAAGNDGLHLIRCMGQGGG